MNLSKIKYYLSKRCGYNITVVYYGQRNRKEIYRGKLLKTYFNVFTVILASGEVKSFNYIDILTKTIKIYV